MLTTGWSQLKGGAKAEHAPITIPKGSRVVAPDGTITTLTADITLFRQRVVVGDSDGPELAIWGPEGYGEFRLSDVAQKLDAIHATLQTLTELMQELVLS